MAAKSSDERPTRDVERSLRADGHRVIVGVDEVGKGAWAGPLAVGIAVIPDETDPPAAIEKLVRDSKSITERKRESMFDELASWCTSWSIGLVSARECDRLGMSRAQRLATSRAFDSLPMQVDAAIVDGPWDFVSPLVPSVTTLVKGDTRCLSIAAASILAKVTRDRLMRDLSAELPMYRFESNKGYPCAWHRAGLFAVGPSTAHRTSWAFMDALGFWGGLESSTSRPRLGQDF